MWSHLRAWAVVCARGFSHRGSKRLRSPDGGGPGRHEGRGRNPGGSRCTLGVFCVDPRRSGRALVHARSPRLRMRLPGVFRYLLLPAEGDRAARLRHGRLRNVLLRRFVPLQSSIWTSLQFPKADRAGANHGRSASGRRGLRSAPACVCSRPSSRTARFVVSTPSSIFPLGSGI